MQDFIEPNGPWFTPCDTHPQPMGIVTCHCALDPNSVPHGEQT
jgi:hypothetical protein